jgi:hypothetical protein
MLVYEPRCYRRITRRKLELNDDDSAEPRDAEID